MGPGRAIATVAATIVLTLASMTAVSAYEWTVAAYLSGDRDLKAAAHRYLNMVVEGASRAGWAVGVQLDETDQDGRCIARRHLWRSQGEKREHISESVPGSEAESGLNMGAQETLSEFLRWVTERAPAKRYALIIMGHGTGLAEPGGSLEGGLANSGVALDVSAGGDCLTAAELAAGIREGIAEAPPPGLDALFLDCCYGANLEVAYELRGIVRYLVGAPGEIPNPGLPWHEILRTAGREDELDGRGIVQTCLRVVSEQDGGQAEPISITAIDLSGIIGVRESLREFAECAVGGMVETAPAITLARTRAATWGSQREFCDAVSLLTWVSKCAADERLASAAKAAAEAVRASVVERVGYEAEVAGGIGLFFPGTLSDLQATYNTARCSFAVDSGWAGLLTAYCQRLRALMQRATERQDEGSGTALWPPGVKSGSRET